jgi:TDG/mug DNA glycosylase family protein
VSTRRKAPNPVAAVKRPTAAELSAARERTVPDVIAKDLRVLFVGINPGLYSGAVGHHFARPGNRFWPTLHRSGFTETLLSPFDEQELARYRLGITNVVARTTARADELADDELRQGALLLTKKVRKYRPAFVAILGVTAFRAAFAEPKAVLGLQSRELAGARLWVLPNPSGLNAHHQLADLAVMFRELHEAADAPTP